MKNKQKNKFYNTQNAFTLVELMIAMAIVGIILVFGMVTMKPTDEGLKYQYSNAYRSLSIAYYNGMLSTNYNPFVPVGDDWKNTDEVDSGAAVLCKALTSYINSNGVGDADYDSGCSSTKLISAKAADSEFKPEKVQFIANNGMKFYISKRLNVYNPVETDYYYYLVFVDVNGDKRPNSMVYNGTVKPDIFPFAVFDNGYVVPLGIPEYDRTIMTATVAYFDTRYIQHYYPLPVAYFQAKGMAWGFYMPRQTRPDANSPEFEVDLSDRKYIDKIEPFTLNDAIRASLPTDSTIVTGLNAYKNANASKGSLNQDGYNTCKQTTSNTDAYCKAMHTTGGLQPKPLLTDSARSIYCAKGDYEACYVVIDEYK